MASSLSSAAAQIRLLGGTSSCSSSTNLAFKQESLKSNRVSFGLFPRSSFLTSSRRRTANGILPVAARKKEYSAEELERMTVEELEELALDEAEEKGHFVMINGEKFIQLVPPVPPHSDKKDYITMAMNISPEEIADARKTEEEKRSTENHGAAKTLSDEYDVGDYIKTKISKDNTLVEGVVVSKEDGLTLLRKEKVDGKSITIYALENDELVGWTEFDIKQKQSM